MATSSLAPKRLRAPFPRRKGAFDVGHADRLAKLRSRAIGSAVVGLFDIGAIEQKGRALCLEEPTDDEALVRKWQSYIRGLAVRGAR